MPTTRTAAAKAATSPPPEVMEAELPTSIHECLLAVMAEVRAVGKDQRNAQQGFNFRGVDAVVNAVAPALRKHRVTVRPDLQKVEYVPMTTSKGGSMTVARVIVAFVFTAPDGSEVRAVVPAESFDTGDKATAKAMSVAFRTALIQTLALPTDEPDPDLDNLEVGDGRGAPPAQYQQAPPPQFQQAPPPQYQQEPPPDAVPPPAPTRNPWDMAQVERLAKFAATAQDPMSTLQQGWRDANAAGSPADVLEAIKTESTKYKPAQGSDQP